jgi:hypothetical protein
MEAVKNRIAMACDPIFLLPDYAIYIADRKFWKPWKTIYQIENFVHSNNSATSPTKSPNQTLQMN